MRAILMEYLHNLLAFDQAHPLLFTDFYFWAFFALVFAGFALLKDRIVLRNAFLFAASLFFYFKTSGLFLMLLVLVVGFNYVFGLLVGGGISNRHGVLRKLLLVFAVIVDLSVLGYYKYAYLVTDIVNNLFGCSFAVHDYIAELGNQIFGPGHFSIDSIFLPVGISFFTFQAISYVVDVWKGKIAPVRNFLDFGFYLSFFPQLVAGPIVRAVDFIPQLHKKFFLGRKQFGIAVFWILNGLAKKLILSDYLAVNLNDRVFANPLLYTGFENLSALVSYSLQVYADFSGYTDIATGVAMLMGFYLPKNFDSPYKARNAGEFWKRWHISLSTWLKDYLYIPLGGNRRASFGTYAIILGIAFLAAALSKSWWIVVAVAVLVLAVAMVAWLCPSSRKSIRSNLNRMDTMLLGGLWHGASWNFMIWGGLNGLGMLIYQGWKGLSSKNRVLLTGSLTLILWILCVKFDYPVFWMFFYWILITFAGAFVRMLYGLVNGRGFSWLANAWAVFQTFVFITFTRLFFRSGSNLNPADANEVAWTTAKNMVNQIGSHWNLSQIPAIISQYRPVFILMLLGMLIHWLPERFKRRYRLWFASMPLWMMAAVVVATVVILYQFVTSDLQTFIYFQF